MSGRALCSSSHAPVPLLLSNAAAARLQAPLRRPVQCDLHTVPDTLMALPQPLHDRGHYSFAPVSSETFLFQRCSLHLRAVSEDLYSDVCLPPLQLLSRKLQDEFQCM